MSGATLAACRAAAAEGHARFPLHRTIVLDGDTAVAAFAKLHRGGYGFLLESLEGGERWARYTILATEPETVYRYHGDRAECRGEDGAWTPLPGSHPPLVHLAALLRDTTAPARPDLPRFTGGAVGFWGYDVVRTLEQLPEAQPDDRGLPDAVVMIAGTVLVLDRLFQRAIVIANVALDGDPDDTTLQQRIDAAESRMTVWLARLGVSRHLAPLDPLPAPAPLMPTPRYDGTRYVEDVARCQAYIAAGDAFQIVLSRRLDVTPAPDPFLTYRWLRALNPAPYCFYLALDDLVLAGASPEVLVRVVDEQVTVRPIAGTRPRGATPEQDGMLEAEMRADPKEVAEHLMLVDLGRNDVGRVASYGTVTVAELMVVERYSRVMHLVSEVRGRLRPDCDALDALGAAFPAGTLSGAPKVRAMQILDILEPTRRGPYGGTVGYVGWGGRTLDTAIAIRTIVFHGDRASVQAGAGVVADSVPAAELAETEAKARAALDALAFSARSGSGTQPLPAG